MDMSVVASTAVPSTTSQIEVVAPTTSEVVAPTTSEVVAPTTSEVVAPTTSEVVAPTSTAVSTSAAPSPTPGKLGNNHLLVLVPK